MIDNASSGGAGGAVAAIALALGCLLLLFFVRRSRSRNPVPREIGFPSSMDDGFGRSDRYAEQYAGHSVASGRVAREVELGSAMFDAIDEDDLPAVPTRNGGGPKLIDGF